MQLEEVLQHFTETATITEEAVQEIKENKELRLQMVDFFSQQEHPFTKALLLDFIERRRNPEKELWGEDLMFASYLIAQRRDVNNALLLWQAKWVDFDTYCMVDGILFTSAGIANTIQFLENEPSEDAKAALRYFQDWDWGPEDEEEIQEYFRTDDRPWYI